MARTKLQEAIDFFNRFFSHEVISVDSDAFEKHWKTVRANIKESRPTGRAKRPVQQRKAKILRDCTACDCWFSKYRCANCDCNKNQWRSRKTSAVA